MKNDKQLNGLVEEVDKLGKILKLFRVRLKIFLYHEFN